MLEQVARDHAAGRFVGVCSHEHGPLVARLGGAFGQQAADVVGLLVVAAGQLLQSLSVRPGRDGQGQETDTFEVPAGGQRFQALQLLVKQKRLAKTAPVPCLVKTDGIAEEDSLAENTMREALHPLDQFWAFQALRDEHGLVLRHPGCRAPAP